MPVKLIINTSGELPTTIYQGYVPSLYTPRISQRSRGSPRRQGIAHGMLELCPRGSCVSELTVVLCERDDGEHLVYLALGIHWVYVM